MGVDASEMMRVQKKKRETNGVKRKDEKRLSEAGDSGWAAGNTSTVCWMAEMEVLWMHSRRWLSILSVPTLECKKNGRVHISVKSDTWRRPACLTKGAQSVMCWLEPFIDNCLQYGTHLLHYLYCLRKVAPSFRGCIIVRSQYFYGWKKVSSTGRCTVGRKKHFVHHSWCLR